MVRKGFYMYPSRKIPVMTLDIHYRLDAATLGEQRRGGSPTPPSALARGRLIVLVACQPRPDNPGILVRDRDCRTVFAAALDQLPYPLTPSVRPAVHPADRRPRAMHQAFTQRGITAFADAEQACLPARGMLARD